MNYVLADYVFLIGRILFAALFLGAGIGHFKAVEAMTGYAQYKKLPAAKASVLFSGAVLIVASIALAVGIYPAYAALALAVFLFPTAIIFHAYWKETDATAKQTEMMAFNKDIALAGAALVIFALVSAAEVVAFAPIN